MAITEGTSLKKVALEVFGTEELAKNKSLLNCSKAINPYSLTPIPNDLGDIKSLRSFIGYNRNKDYADRLILDYNYSSNPESSVRRPDSLNHPNLYEFKVVNRGWHSFTHKPALVIGDPTWQYKVILKIKTWPPDGQWVVSMAVGNSQWKSIMSTDQEMALTIDSLFNFKQDIKITVGSITGDATGIIEFEYLQIQRVY